MNVKVVYATESKGAIDGFRDLVRRIAGGEADPAAGAPAPPPPRPMRQPPHTEEEPRQP